MATPKRINGRALAAIRKLRGVTQVQLAETLGRSESWVAAVEGCRIDCNDDTLAEIARVLFVEVDALRLAEKAAS